MGALHAGHLALVRRPAAGRRVVVSIFVNPAQFAPHEDLATYPRSFDSDLAALAALGVDSVWAPAGRNHVSGGFRHPDRAGRARPRPASRTSFRPHFFAGVATVVAKLLIQCQPDFAVFGEKDYQQLKVVTQLVRDLDLPLRIVGVPTVRETDGLAMSSRNAYLSAGDRAAAPTLHRVLMDCAGRIAAGELIARVLDEGGAAIERAGFTLDYLEARHAETLAPVEAVKRRTDPAAGGGADRRRRG